MPVEDLIREMNEYYRKNVHHHDECMSYTDNLSMEKLLASIIERIEKDIKDKDVLEIACGTGNWTQVLSKRARSVVACDINEAYLIEAKKKEYQNDKVVFKVADAYRLQGIDRKFNLAFGADWFSHIPKSTIKRFIETLHSKLLPGSKVIMIDMLPKPELDRMFSHIDHEGNVIQKRILPNGKEYQVVKNFPAEKELADCLKGYGININYYKDDKLIRWVLTYTVS
jgi:demethylmenaquinone methyltransferase/2-methoxy-6-polyprenyl-1,4-benzoquinol methylase